MIDYSEITAGLNKKILSMNTALTDKKWMAAKVIIQNILVDFEDLYGIVSEKIKAESDNQGEQHE